MKATLASVRPIVASGHHNAFVALCRWREHYYIAYRQADSHGIASHGRICLQRSLDLIDWELCGIIDTPGDDRDPTFLPLEKQLVLGFATYYERNRVPAGTTLTNAGFDIQSQLSSSLNGITWTLPWEIFRPNYWLWSYVDLPDAYYALAYHTGQPMVVPDIHSLHLLKSFDLVRWRTVTTLLPNDPRLARELSEPVLFVPARGRLGCVTRAEHGPAVLGYSRSPYKHWNWHDLGVTVHSPAVAQTPHGQVLAGRGVNVKTPSVRKKSRASAKSTGKPVALTVDAETEREWVTKLWHLQDNHTPHELLELPSSGDCAYPDLLWDDERLLCLYYSQHGYDLLEVPWPHTPSDVYLAEIELQGDPPGNG